MIASLNISVVVPVYNTPGNYLAACLDSLSKQTITAFEVLIVDDGSTEQTSLAAIDQFVQSDPRFRVIHQPNSGVSSARNRGMAEARGTWISFVDADDWLERNMLERLYTSAQSNSPDIVVCDCVAESPKKVTDNHFLPTDYSLMEWNDYAKTMILLQIFGENNIYNPPKIAIGVPWAKLFRKAFLEERGIVFPKGLSRYEDNIFNLYAFHHARRVEYVSECLYHYRELETSATNKFTPRITEVLDMVHEQTREFLNVIPNGSRFKQAYYARIIQSVHALLRYCYFHPDNPSSYAQRRSDIVTVLNRPPYNTALHQIRLRDSPRSVQLFTVLLRLHCFRVLHALIRARNYIKQR